MAGMVAQGITIKFSANTSGLTDGAKQAQNVIGGFAKVGAVALLAVGAAAVAGGVAAVKMAGDFQAGMTSLVTGAGESQKNIKMVSQGILDMAVQTGTSTKQLTDGMYMIESAGFHGADGLNVLKAAAEGAKVGNADLASVANGVTTALTDYKLPASQATAVTNDLIATVAAGKTHMQDLASALSTILPTAAAVGVSLKDVSGAMATMTGEGTSAAQASTYLRQLLMALENPAKKGADALKSVGLSTQQVSDEMKVSLPATLQMITDAVGKKFPVGSAAYVSALANISGGSKQMQGMLELTGQHLDTFKNNITGIAGAVKQGGNSITGWSNVQATFNFKLQQAQEVLETTGIKIGTALLPSVGKLLDKVTPLITKFGDWLVKSGTLQNAATALANTISTLATWVSNIVGFFEKNHAALAALQTIILIVAGVIAGALVFALKAWTVSAWEAAVATFAATWEFLLVGAVIGAVIAVIILAIQHWGAITKWFQGVWGAVSNWFMGVVKAVGSFFEGVWRGIASFFMSVWNGIVAGLKAAWAFIVNVVKIGAEVVLAVLFGPIIAIVALFQWLYNHNYYFKALVDAIVNFFKACFTWLQGAWTATINWLVGAWQKIVAFATVLWDNVSMQVKIGFEKAIMFVRGVWNAISSFFVNAWNTYIAGPLKSLWDKVSGVFSSAWNTYIAGPLGRLWNSVSKWFADLGTAALNSGINFITMLASGIASGAGRIWNAVVSIAKTIWKALGFHSPAEEGPASDADKWMPNFVTMLDEGLLAGVPKIQKAASQLAMPLALNFNAKFQYPQASATSSPQIIVHVHNSTPDIYMDTHKVTDILTRHQANMIRLKGDVRSR